MPRPASTALTLAAMLSLAAIASITVPARAHEVRHEVSREEATVLRLTHEDGSAFSDERYELFYGDEGTPRQVGRTDAQGRIVFVPDRKGVWRLRAFSEDGHGADVSFEAAPSGTPASAPAPAGGVQRLVTGISLIFGVFGLIVLFLRRRPGR